MDLINHLYCLLGGYRNVLAITYWDSCCSSIIDASGTCKECKMSRVGTHTLNYLLPVCISNNGECKLLMLFSVNDFSWHHM